ncbi:MAG: shikimate kinase [Planctomycetota bacterium]
MRDSLWLVGYRASGKSTVGRRLAQRLGWSFSDTDDLIAEIAGRPVGEVFEELGEAAFRRAEVRALEELRERAGDWVIATGGGVVESEENRRLLRRERVVFLDAPAEVLQDRLRRAGQGAGGRPPLTDQGVLAEVPVILARRVPWYREVATRVVDAELEVDGIVADLVDWLSTERARRKN